MEKVVIGNATLYHADCMDVLPTLGKVDAVITDPPYMGVVDDEWDNQWGNDSEFLAYISNLLGQFHTLLVDNGSLYFFASSRMAAMVEMEIRKKFNVLNNIVWSKGASRKGAAGTGIDVTTLRRFWSAATERLIFAEKYGADGDYQGALIDENSTYWGACENAKIKIIGDYLKGEFDRAGKANREIAALFPSKTGGLTGCVSNWINGANFPTQEQYLKIRDYLNGAGCQYLRREYEDLRREYEDLRREYEDLRRPFNVNTHMQWGELWEFQLSRNRTGHPCEKPETLMSHIVTISSREGQAVLDPFMGSGTTGVACMNLDRKFIGIEIDKKYFDIACERIERAQQQLKLAL
jgi:site-specific DNA-methyltransferase (adenine-specific)